MPKKSKKSKGRSGIPPGRPSGVAGKKPRSRLLDLPATPQYPTYEVLSKALKDLGPHLTHGGFNEFVIVGFRRVPPAEQAKAGGQTEMPYYFQYGNPINIGSLLEWANKDLKNKHVKEQRRLIEQKKREEKQGGAE